MYVVRPLSLFLQLPRSLSCFKANTAVTSAQLQMLRNGKISGLKHFVVISGEGSGSCNRTTTTTMNKSNLICTNDACCKTMKELPHTEADNTHTVT